MGDDLGKSLGLRATRRARPPDVEEGDVAHAMTMRETVA
jgi:hypothetical protein